MKLTKVNNVRIAVSKKNNRSGRGILYPVPNNEEKPPYTMHKQIVDRIKEANKLYHVFFRYDIPKDLEYHFKQVFCIATKSSHEDIVKDLSNYTGYTFNRKRMEIKDFSYKPTGKKIKQVMTFFVRQRMADMWMEQKYCEAAVSVLMCLCDGENYQKEIKKIPPECLMTFMDACKKYKEQSGSYYPYVDETGALEDVFSQIISEMARQCDVQAYLKNDEKKIKETIGKQIRYLKELKKITLQHKVINLSTYKYPYASDDRMDAVLFRMKKTLKRGSLHRTATSLLQAVAQMDKITLKSFIENIERDEQKYSELEKFIDAVNKDYYRTNIFKSIKKIDVKVQPNNGQLDLSNANHRKKAALNQTLEEYAASRESSDAVLLRLKRLLFEYFSYDEFVDKEKYLTVEKIWSFPDVIPFYFDDGFVPEKRVNKEESDIKQEEDEKSYKEENDINQKELETLWAEVPRDFKKIKERIRFVNYGKYLRVTRNKDDSFRKYWASYIMDYIEEHYILNSRLSSGECYSNRMIQKCWKDMIGFICGKYIDIGKTVYHFAIPETVSLTDNLRYGDIREEYKDGVSSFSYEIIKAEETLQRDITNASVAALSNFSRAAINYSHPELVQFNKAEDILFIPNKKEAEINARKKGADENSREFYIEKFLKKNAGEQMLRFFGGMSEFTEKSAFLEENWAQNLVFENIGHFKKIRNTNFHYAPGKVAAVPNKYAKILCQNDIAVYQKMIRERYYSNNVNMFYGKKEIRQLVEKLYKKVTVSEAQIPAFRTIWKRKDLPEYMESFCGVDVEKQKDIKIYGGALYFLLKEIYYHEFISHPDMGALFFKKAEAYVKKHDKNKNKEDNAENKEKNKEGDTENKEASKENNKKKIKYYRAGSNFWHYVKKFKVIYEKGDITFGTVCQNINEEFNQQNAKEEDKEIYKHFKLLFPLCLKMAFQEFIAKHYSFLGKPVFDGLKGERGYLDDVGIGCIEEYYSNKHRKQSGKEGCKTGAAVPAEYLQLSNWQYSWFMFAHFISPRQLNHLVGNMKNYIQYRQDIFRRTEYAGQFMDKNARDRAAKEVQQRVEGVKEVLQILELVRSVAGRVSNVFSDYYESKEEYAKYLSQYIDFPVPEGASCFESLKYFCQKALSDGKIIDLYADAENPKVLRNIELARMYAGGDIYLKGHKKVTLDEIKIYYQKKDKIEKILSKGLCETEGEQKEVKEYQNLKTHLTLNDVTDLYEIISGLLGQLASLIYLRERDELFLYLGFFSMTLRNKEAWQGENLDSINEGKYKIQSGFVLYQVVSVFDFGIKLLYQNKENQWETRGGAIPGKINSLYIKHKASMDCALRLFGNEKYRDDIIELRNYIDHSKYFMHSDKSMLDLYNEFFAKFFWYSKKLRKCVLFIFGSLMEHYFVKTNIEFTEKKFRIKDKLVSDVFTYKLKDNKTVTLPARDGVFLQELQQVLEHGKSTER